MRRSDFGSWGAELDADDFARAIAALGLRSGRSIEKTLADERRYWYQLATCACERELMATCFPSTI